ncbi:MAG: hypothetical protein J7K68_02735 [Candidatus Diapherotrites archaeon]|nr:hypothetical protein [Candidatus Diapherotrites archaeon]
MISGKGYAYGTIKTFIPDNFELPKIKGATVQMVNPNAVLGNLHMKYCILSTIKAFSSKTNISKDMGIELLLRLSGQRQVGKALKTLGVKPGDKRAILIVLGKQPKRTFNRILKQLNAKEIKTKEKPLKQQLDAIEKTALLGV